jgi:probable rRNA maturation factor
MKKLIFSKGRCGKILKKSESTALKKYAERAMEIAKIAKSGPVILSLATPNEIREIKKKFFGLDVTTDVISFKYGPTSGQQDVFAELIVCPHAAKKYAKENSVSFIRELVLYAVHGILHIAGEDDSKPSEISRMRKKEKMIMKRLCEEFPKLL